MNEFLKVIVLNGILIVCSFDFSLFRVGLNVIIITLSIIVIDIIYIALRDEST